MATITADTYLDGGTARTAGESWTCNGGKLTVRTDTRWHANAPASMTGSLSSVTVSATLGGGFMIDARNVRWMAFDAGSGTVPAIGTTVSGGTSGASGYLLGVWADYTSAPTAVGASMPTTGFIKFREVTGGPFQDNDVLSGISATANGADRAGWVEVVMDASSTITVSRKGSGSVTRGDWFYLDDTNGSVAQVLQVPTNGGGANTYCPGVWIETEPSSGEYEFWPALNGSTNGWAVQHLGAPVGYTDRRQSFVKSIGSGQMQIGESSVSASLTYTITSSSGTYTWANDVVTVSFTAHGMSVGESVYLDFTSGGATADGVYTVEQVTGANTFTVALSGAGTSGNVTLRARAVISYANHVFNQGNTLYLNASSGDLADGVYEVISVVTGASGTITVAATPSTGTGGNLTIEQTIGHVPESGCKTRIPNIFLRQCATGSRATNSAPNGTIANRPDFTTSGAGIVDHEFTYGDWYYLTLQAYQTRLVHVATFDAFSVAECATALDLNDAHAGMYGALDVITLTLTSNFAGGTIANSKFLRSTVGTGDHSISMATCIGQTFDNCTSGIIQYGRSSGYSWNISQSTSITLTDCRQINGGTVAVITCTDVEITDLDHVDRFIGFTNAGSATYVVTASSKCNGVVIDGITEGYAGTIERQHAYAGFLNVTASDNVKLRNAGTRAAPLSYTKKMNDRAYVYLSGGNNYGITLQRIYVGSVRTGLISDVNSDKNVLYESVSAPHLSTWMPYTLTVAALNATVKGVKAPLNVVAANASVYGSHLYDQFSAWFRMLGTYTWSGDVATITFSGHGLSVGDKVYLNFTSGGATADGVYTVKTTGTTFTVALAGSGTAGNVIIWRNLLTTPSDLFTTQGLLCLPMHEPTTETSSYVAITGTAQFTSAPSLTFPAANDEAVWTSQYTIKGHTAFPNIPPTLTGIVTATQSSTYTWSGDVLTVTFTAHGLAVGDKVWIDATSGTLPDGLYTVAGITSANVYTVTLAGSGTSGNAVVYRFLHLRYKIDTGSGYSAYKNLSLRKGGCATTSGSATITMPDTSGIAVDDYVYGVGVAPDAQVVSIDSSTQITVSANSVATGSTALVLEFNYLPNETISASTGFNIQISAKAVTPGSTMVITYLTIPTTTTATAQDNLYPLATNTLTLTGLKNPTEVRVFDAGTTTEIGGQETVTSGTFTTQIDAGTYPDVDIAVISLGYQNTRLLGIDMSGGNVSIPVQQVLDRQYQNA